MFAYVYGISTGLTLGLAIAFLITVKIVKKSNDIGDSHGNIYDFGGKMDVLSHEDNLKNVY
ncbi:MAG: hypothetical protein J5856_05280 [Lachnospiraceae bacterium]|nr:hypothetical protein [Lachnospiraceae bacterium]